MRHLLCIAFAALVLLQAEARSQPQEEAKAIVAKAIKALKDAGVAAAIRTPWGK